MSEAEAASAAETAEEAEAQGFFGEADPRDRDEYALTSGPESPSALEGRLQAVKAEADAQLEELKTRAQDKAAGAKEKASEHRAARQAKRSEGE